MLAARVQTSPAVKDALRLRVKVGLRDGIEQGVYGALRWFLGGFPAH